MPEGNKILKAIRKQIAVGMSQYLLVAICAAGTAAAIAHHANHAINAKLESVLAAMKRH